MNEQTHLLRWKGVTSGPHRIATIQAMLDKGQASKSHQILVKGQWMTLEEFFAAVRPKNTVKPENHAAPLVLPRRETETAVPEYAPKTKGTFQAEHPISDIKVAQQNEDVATSNAELSGSWTSTAAVQAVTIKMSFDEVLTLCFKFTAASILISILFAAGGLLIAFIVAAGLR